MKKWFFSLLLSACAAWALTPAEVVVVYNADSALSERTARRYCALRHISPAQMVPLRGVKGGDISRQDYESKIRSALLYAADCNQWCWPTQRMAGRRTMRAMVLMPDLPLRIQESSAVVEARRRKAQAAKEGKTQEKTEWTPGEAAGVDSELALLGAQYSLAAGINNPFFGKDADISSARPVVMAVTRIDGPDEACIRRMTEDPVRVEKTGLFGWVIIDQGGPYPQGEKMFDAAATAARRAYMPLLHETSGKTLAPSFPMMEQTAVYFGWYSYKADGPFAGTAAGEFRFAPGAIAGHLHSFSCTRIKDETDWAPALLKRGAAVSFGNVYEPYLGGCHDFGVFFDRLLKGYTVAEAALMSTPMVSWQEVVFGDPLYRPFAAQQQHRPADNPFALWQETAKMHFGRPDALEPVVKSQLAKPHGALFAEAFGYLCADEKKWRLATEAFRAAANASSKPADKLRNTLMLITVMHLNRDSHGARDLMLRTLEETRRSPYRPAVERTASVVIPQEWAEMKKAAEAQQPKK